MLNQIVECCPCYELKYDETAECLRDQTFAELKVSYGKGSKIQCNCWSDRIREYKVDSAFVAGHMKSQRHINWREEQQKEHKQKYGHCISNEKIIEALRKENRDYKKTHASSVKIISKKDEIIIKNDEKLALLSKKLDDMTVENDLLKAELEEYQEEPEEREDEKNAPSTDEFNELKMENETLKAEWEELKTEWEKSQIALIVANKAKDKLQREVDTRKCIMINKKKSATNLEPRQPFR